jgi:hypothetical protein
MIERSVEAVLVVVPDEEVEHVPALANEPEVCRVEAASASDHDVKRTEALALHPSERAAYSEARDAGSRGKFAELLGLRECHSIHIPSSKIVSEHCRHHDKLPSDC